MIQSKIYQSIYFNWWRSLDKTIFFLVIFLFSLGLFFSLVSTSLVASDRLNTNSYQFFFKHLIYIIIGVFIVFLFSYMSTKNLFLASNILFIVCFIGLASGAGGVLFWSMVPDTIEYGEWKSGFRSESSLYGFMTLIQKSSIAVAILVLGILLTYINFEPNQKQSEETLVALKNIMALIIRPTGI